MFSALLDVGIGLILVFLVLSVMASSVSEFIGNILQRRAKSLEYFITCTLVGSGLTTKDFYEKTLLSPHMQANQRPSYIQAADFVDALFTTLRSKNPRPSTPTEGEMPDFSLDELKNMVSGLPDNAPLKKVLSSVIVKAQGDPNLKKIDGDVAKVRASLEQWYDNSMDHVSGWYKNWTHYLILVIGLGIAVIFNVDTISITNNLLENPGIRSAIAAQASTISQNLATAVPNATPSSPSSTTTGQGTSTGAIPNTISSTQSSLSTLEGELQALNMPIGWPDPGMANADINWWLKKIIGLLITGFAVSQGAPFWFDLLNKITNLRSNEKPPEKADMPTS